MANSDTILYTPDQNSAGNLLPYALLAGNGGFGGLGGNGLIPGMLLGSGMGYGGFGGFGGGGFIPGIFGGVIGGLLPRLFGGSWGGGYGGGIGAQINSDNNTDLVMEALHQNANIVGQLATSLNSDFNAVQSGLNTISSAVQTVGAQNGMSALQIVNAIQAGDASLSRQFCEALCSLGAKVEAQGYQNQLRTVEQTNTLGAAISGSGQRTVDAIADLKTTIVKEFCDAKERDMQDKINTQSDIITQLRNQISNDKQTEVFASAFNVLSQKVTDLAARQPNTVPVQWPALTAVNTTPYVNGGFYGGWGNGFGFGNGVSF